MGKGYSDSPEQLIPVVVYMAIGALVSESLSHAWGLRLRCHFQSSGFPSTYVINVLHQNTRALVFQCDLMLMGGRIVHKVKQKGLLELWVCTIAT